MSTPASPFAAAPATLAGASLLVLSGLAWFANSLATNAAREALNCGIITLGYAALAFTVLRMPRVIPAGLAVAAAANTAWVLLYPFPKTLDVGVLAFGLGVGGLLAASLAVREGRMAIACAGFASAALGALVPVIQNDVLGHLTAWTPGNVLALSGFVALAYSAVAGTLRPGPEAGRATSAQR